MRNKVCAVIVTYNRKELLKRNIDAILQQTVLADIYIYDNCSTDGTGEYIQQQNYDSHVIYYHAEQNTGGAGGFSHGVQAAYDMGYEYIWMMDDDGYPLNDRTLEILLTHAKEERDAGRKALYNSLVVCEPVEQGGDDLLSFTLFGERHISELQSSIRNGELAGEASTFNSTFFHRNLVTAIGTINADFFIYGDDTDYVKRAERAGYQIITVINSRYYHPDSNMGHRRVLGKIVAMREQDLSRTYYYVRNYMYIVKKYSGKPQAILHAVKVLVKTLWYREQRWKKLQITMKGLRDGYREELKIRYE